MKPLHHFLAGCCVLLALSAQAEVIDIDNDELVKLSASGVPVVDVRTVGEWEETGIVPSSHLLTFFDERGNADPVAWLDKLQRIAKPGEPVALICRSGNRTKAVSQFLSGKAGYAKVYNVKGGIRSWVGEGRKVAPAAPVIASCKKASAC